MTNHEGIYEWVCRSCPNGRKTPCVLRIPEEVFIPSACPFYEGTEKAFDRVQWERVTA